MSQPERHVNGSSMPAGRVFSILRSLAPDAAGSARLGRLTLPGRREILTPNYTAVTSRGAIPHLTPDNVSQHTSFGATYMALEDFVEKKDDAPIYKVPDGQERKLHQFTAMSRDRATVLAARRCEPVKTPMGNSAQSVTLFTSTGFAAISPRQYAAAVEALQPDVAIPLADALHSSTTPASKKLIKMVERTEEWLDVFLHEMSQCADPTKLETAIFAPLLPIEHPLQWGYLKHIVEDLQDQLAGLALYDVDLLPELKLYPSLTSLPKLSLRCPATPHEVLQQVFLGADLCTIPFVNTASDSGVALAFAFPAKSASSGSPKPLAIDMWSTDHRTAVEPLMEGCQCYVCAHHHRAYVHHLLSAKEMLGWVLLQIHNYQILDTFFHDIRELLRKDPGSFEEEMRRFSAAYEMSLPEGTGDRPRVRGYHFKSECGQSKRNKPGWTQLNEKCTSVEDRSNAVNGEVFTEALRE